MGRDYRIVVVPRSGSSVTVVAPHGGLIEPGTSEIARAIAGDELSLYLFEGTKAMGNHAVLHLPSPKFDEPTCLALLRNSPVVLAVHGYNDIANTIHVGGLDFDFAERVALSLRGAGFEVDCPSSRFPGRNPLNVCNRGKNGRGVQLEFSFSLRQRYKPSDLATPIRQALDPAPERKVNKDDRAH
jgi:phage replication-related protein YjqB (UPF0714/DUF867 family)